MRDSSATIQRFTGDALNATLTTTGPLKDRLVKLADGLVEVSRSATRYADGGDPAVFAEVVGRVRQGWEDVYALARLVRPVDQDLLDKIERGSSFVVGATAETVYGLTIGPFGTSSEADQAASRIGNVELVSREAPFVVRVGTFTDKAAAEEQVTALSAKGFAGILTEEQRFRFMRTGPAPAAELWREPERLIETRSDARRVAITSDLKWVVTGSDNGAVAIFSGDGVLRALPQFHAGVSHLEFSDDGAWVMGGAITLVNFILPEGVGVGVPVQMPAPAQKVIYVPGTHYFAAIAPEGDGSVIAGRAPDGVQLSGPFPIRIPGPGGIAANGVGELYVAWNVDATTIEIDVLNMAGDRRLNGVLRLPGKVSDLVVSRDGAHGAILTDRGVFRFGPHAPDPSATLKRVADPVRQIGLGSDGTLYLMAQTKLTALDPNGETTWTSSLIDGRRLITAARPLVLDGADRLLTFSEAGDAEDLGTTGTVVDVTTSADGRRIGVLADGRVQVFRLPE